MSAAIATGHSLEDAIWAAHLPHHLGIDRTFYLREQVKQELAGCEACQRIDPALQGENLVAKGDLAVEDNWSRVAVDVTHYDNQFFCLWWIVVHRGLPFGADCRLSLRPISSLN